MIDLSIIVPSYNGAKKLPNLLTSLEKQSFKKFEVIIVVDGSTDNTKDVLKSNLWNLELNVVYQENRGRAGARNRGAEEARTYILLFVDDDIELTNKCIEQSVLDYQNKREIHFGNVQLKEIVINRSFLDLDFHNFRLHSESQWRRKYSLKPMEKIEFSNYRFTSSYFLIHKSTFNTLGRFNNILTDSEDFDLSLQALKKKVPIFHNKVAIAYHLDFRTIKDYIRRQIEYKKSKIDLLKIHPEYEQILSESYSFDKLRAKSIYLYFFNYKYFWSTILNSSFWSIIPKKMRYKTYSLIVLSTSNEY